MPQIITDGVTIGKLMSGCCVVRMLHPRRFPRLDSADGGGATAYNLRMSLVARILLMLGCVLVCQLAGILGVLTADTGNSPWYLALHKPSFTPPGWVFGPVWGLLYTLMGVTLYMLLRNLPQTRLAVALFVVQLVLNSLWTPVFFGMHQVGWGLVVIVLLWVGIAGTMVASWGTNPVAAGLLVPYLLWVTFATVLNAALLRLNP